MYGGSRGGEKGCGENVMKILLELIVENVSNAFFTALISSATVFDAPLCWRD